MLHSELGPVMLSYGKPALPEASDTITATRANPAKYLNVLPILLLFLPEAFLNAFKGLFFVWGWDVQFLPSPIQMALPPNLAMAPCASAHPA